MRFAGLLALSLFALAGCSDDDPTPAAPVDSGGTADVAVDSAKPDTTPVDTGTDTGSEAAVTDTGADVTPDVPDTFDACTEVGHPCSVTQPCPGSLRCYGSGGNGFCAPAEPECGGFVMKMCAGGRVCLRAGGSSLGYCATPEEKPCVCGKTDAGYTVDGC